MKKLHLTRHSAILLAHLRFARLEARIEALASAMEAGCTCHQGSGPVPDPPGSVKRTLWIFTILIVFAILLMVGLMYWGTKV
jgi:hypothetical protein